MWNLEVVAVSMNNVLLQVALVVPYNINYGTFPIDILMLLFDF